MLDEMQKSTALTVAAAYSYKVGARSYSGALSFNGAFSRELLRKRVLRVFGLRVDVNYLDTWREILRRVQPKYVLSIQPHPALCRACHEQGISVFDVQHGYIGPNNPSYGEEFQMGRERKEMADCILCWDEDSAASIRGWTARKQIAVRVIGNPWINKFATKGEEDKVVRFFKDQYQLVRKGGDRPQILVSLQWGLDDPALTPNQDLFDNSFMPIALDTVIRQTLGQYDWILRPHPAQCLNQKTFKALKAHVGERFGLAVRISENEPLPFVLSNADLHITYNSSVVIEAEFFDVPSAVLDPQINGGLWAGYFSSQIGKGVASLLPCRATAIQDWIDGFCAEPGARAHKHETPVLPAYAGFLEEIDDL
jgi:hypothetical protein